MTQLSEALNRPSTLQDVIRSTESIVHETCAVSGTPGLAIGIFDHEKTVQKHCLQFGSICKSFTAIAVACLDADGKIHWDDKLETFLEDFRGTRNGQFTIRDLLSHRTGLCRSDALFIGSDNGLLLTKAEGTRVFAHLDASCPPRQNFIYNNFGYHAVGLIIERISGLSYGGFLAQRVFNPLGMSRTFTEMPPAMDDNVAQAYVPYHDMKLRQVPAPKISNDTVSFAAGSIRSCMSDMLAFYSSLLRDLNADVLNPDLHHLGSSDLRPVFESVMPLPGSCSLREQSYSLGWVRTQLPNSMGALTGNSGLLDTYPIIGDMEHAPLIIHHGGNNLGCSAAIYLLPELNSGIIALGNAWGHGDATDWTAQVLLEAYLLGTLKTSFPRVACLAATRARCAMDEV